MLRQHGADPLVARDLQLGEAIKWENAGGRALEEATSRALQWLRAATANAEADPREVAAALSAVVASSHRLSEAGSRRAKRLQPAEQLQAQRFDLQGFLEQVGQACSQVKALPEADQPAALAALRKQLNSNTEPHGQTELIDVEVIEAKGL
jgi:hypothetical protein